MSASNNPAATALATAAAVTGALAAAAVAIRLGRAWRNMKIIQSVDTGSVWTTD